MVYSVLLCSHVWSQLAVDWETSCKKKWKQIRELAWRGVPNPMRTLVWPLLAGVGTTKDTLKERYPQLLAVSPVATRGVVVCREGHNLRWWECSRCTIRTSHFTHCTYQAVGMSHHVILRTLVTSIYIPLWSVEVAWLVVPLLDPFPLWHYHHQAHLVTDTGVDASQNVVPCHASQNVVPCH